MCIMVHLWDDVWKKDLFQLSLVLKPFLYCILYIFEADVMWRNICMSTLAGSLQMLAIVPSMLCSDQNILS